MSAGAKPEPRPKFKVIIGKPGLDGHDRGSRLVEALPKNDTGKVLKTELRGWAETPEPD